MADAVMHTIHNADLLAHLRGNRWLVQNGYIPKAHAVLCDPPYGLAFMGKEWDTLGAVEFQAWVTEWAEMLLDYVHPGALGLFFGGTRTYHRLAAGLEDAGWEITDCIMWVHGQGFPKSASLGKLLDKEAGATREVVGVSRSHGLALKPGKSTYVGEFLGERPPAPDLTAPATPLAARWEGYGTALKPAFEPVVVARAPRGKRTYAALAREFGTGALAIDAARIGTDAITTNGWGISRQAVYNAGSGLFSRDDMNFRGGEHAGRWPANFALVCTCESDDHAADCPTARLGEEARFFYQAKAAAWEREAGLNTVQHVWYNKANGNGGQTWASMDVNQSTPAASDTPPRRVITVYLYGTVRLNPSVSSWRTYGHGSSSTGRSRKGIRYTTGTGISRTIASKTLRLSIPPRTSASTMVVNCAPVSGGSPARSVVSSSLSTPSTGISAKKAGPYTASADHVTSRELSETSKSADDQGRKNRHPCIKPIRLAEYLARLILPPAGDEPRRLLVPFAGSGSEMIGALLAGWDAVTGIEREAEYVDLARARVGWWAQFRAYDEARAAYEQERKAKPAPVVIDEKPYTLPMLIMEQVCTSANA
jgi:hypothetical protein